MMISRRKGLFLILLVLVPLVFNWWGGFIRSDMDVLVLLWGLLVLLLLGWFVYKDE